jgi:hypothetical protein
MNSNKIDLFHPLRVRQIQGWALFFKVLRFALRAWWRCSALPLQRCVSPLQR